MPVRPPEPLRTDPPFADAWSFPWLWWADHWSRDYAKFWGRVATANDPVDAANAEGQLNADLVRDGLTAWVDLCSLPLRVLSTAAGTAQGPNAGDPL
jgi:hypothetical protein